MLKAEKYIIDASVFVKWFVVETHSNIANEIRDEFLEGKFELSAPDFFPYEVINALIYSKLFNNKELDEVNIALNEYEISFLSLSNNLAVSATSIALLHKVTIYDAYYLALAVHVDCKFITADSKFYRKFIDSEYFDNILLLKYYKQSN